MLDLVLTEGLSSIMYPLIAFLEGMNKGLGHEGVCHPFWSLDHSMGRLDQSVFSWLQSQSSFCLIRS